MKKRIYILLLTLIAVLVGVLGGCDSMEINFPDKTNIDGNGEVTMLSETLGGGEYKLVVQNIYTNNGALTIEDSNTLGAKVETDSNIMHYISITVAEGVITINGDDDYFFKTQNLKINIGANVSDIRIDGAFELDIKQSDNSDFKIEINGACKGDIAVGSLDSFRMVTNGAGGINLAGECDKGYIELNGAGNIEAFELAAVDLDVVINGAGSMNVWASGELSATVNGVGKITYDGNPTNVNENISGLGKIKAK